MGIDFAPLITFVMVTTFTPGPNNISSAAMGLLYGYRNTVSYLAGIAAGFFIIMLMCAYVSSALLKLMPAIEPLLRVVGATYILWLAVGTARASYIFSRGNISPLGFKNGFLLQTFNPKVIIYGLTLYSSFLSSAAENQLALSVFAALFAMTAFCATSTWALSGASIKTYLREPRLRIVVNAVLVFLLVYAAVDLSGVFSLMN